MSCGCRPTLPSLRAWFNFFFKSSTIFSDQKIKLRDI
jgi:hypothetical protein